MTGQLDHLHKRSLGVAAAYDEPLLDEPLLEGAVELVAVPVSLGDLAGPVGLHGARALRQGAAVRAETHGSPLPGEVPLIGEEIDDRLRGLRVELGAVGVLQAASVPGELDHGELHAQADPEIRDAGVPGIPGRPDHALDAAVAEASGHQDPVNAAKELGDVVFLHERFRIHVDPVDPHAVEQARVLERLVEALVGVGELHVLADHRDAHLLFPALEDLHELLPALHHWLAGPHAQVLHDPLVEPLAVILHRHLVDVAHVDGIDDRVLLHVAEQGDLLLQLAGKPLFGPAQQDVRLDADLAELLHGVLGGLGLELARGGDVGHQGEVDVQDVGASHVEAELPDRLEEGQRLDVAHGAADLHDGDVAVVGRIDDARFDLVGDVRDHLHGLAQVLAAALLLDDRIVDLARGEVVLRGQGRRGEPLVVAQVQVGLGAVVGDEDLAVLERAHGAGVHVDVGIQLDIGDLEPPRLHDGPDGRGSEPLAQGGEHSPGDKDVLGRFPVRHVRSSHPLNSERARTHRRRPHSGRDFQALDPIRSWISSPGPFA